MVEVERASVENEGITGIESNDNTSLQEKETDNKGEQEFRERRRKAEIFDSSIECPSLSKHSAILFLSRQQIPVEYSLYQ